jgi:hypothetical protein
MPTLQIQTENGTVDQTETPGDITARELLREYLDLKGLPVSGENGREWTILDKKTDKILELDRTLDQLGLQDGNELRVFQQPYAAPQIRCPRCQFVNRAETKFCIQCGSKIGTDADLKLELIGPDGRSHQAEMPSDTRTEDVVKELIQVCQLQPGNWVLIDQKRDRKLDSEKTLKENGVVTGQQLHLGPHGLPIRRPLDENTLVKKEQLSRARSDRFREWKKVALILAPIALIGLVLTLVRRFVPVELSVEPKGPVTLSPSQTWDFTATLKNSRQGVSWTISPEIGDVSSTDMVGGNVLKQEKHATYKAPPVVSEQQTVRIIVRSVDDPAKTATAEVILIPDVHPVSVSPANVTISPGHSTQFSADTDVSWSLEPAVGTITTAGAYTAPQEVPTQQTITVVATGKANAASSGRATISLTASKPLAPTRVVVSPSSVALDAGQQFQFRATVEGGGAVTWSLIPAMGHVSEHGLYAAPPRISSDSAVHVSARTNSAGPATATIWLKAVTLTPISGPEKVPPNGLITLRTTVLHSSNGAVAWTINPKVGSISPQGVYTPPASIARPVDVVVVATSLADPSKSTAPYVIHVVPLRPQILVTLNPYNHVMHNSEQQRFSATVTGTSNTAVTWLMVGPGKISPDGVYVAPAASEIRPGGETVTITATSNADSSRSASGQLKLLRPR